MAHLSQRPVYQRPKQWKLCVQCKRRPIVKNYPGESSPNMCAECFKHGGPKKQEAAVPKEGKR